MLDLVSWVDGDHFLKRGNTMFCKGKIRSWVSATGNAMGEGKTVGSWTSESGIPGKRYRVRDLGVKVEVN